MAEHLQGPKSPAHPGADLYCPNEKEFTSLYMGESSDGLQTWCCGACREPEPETRVVTDEELDAIAKELGLY